MQKGKYILLFLFFFNYFNATRSQSPVIVKVSLDSLFKIADNSNRTLKISDYNERMAAEQVIDEKSKYLPAFDVSASASYLGDAWIADRNFSNGTKATMPHFGNNFAIEATQVIYAGRSISTAIDIAELNQTLAKLDKAKDQEDIRFIIAGYYLELLKLNNQKRILANSIIQTKKLLEQIKAKYDQGTSLRNNSTRYELQLQSLELSLFKLENQRTIINNDLVKTLQLPRGSKLEPMDSLATGELKIIDAQPWQDLATEYSPLLKQTQIWIKQSEQYETLTKSDKLPHVFAFAGDKLDGPITIEVPPINKNLNYWYVGVGIKYNIASLYKSNIKTSIAKIATQKAHENTDLVKDQLTTDIDAAYLRFLETQKVYETQLTEVDLATENYTTTKNRYVNDLVLITEMLDAENSKIDAELQAANAQINILFHYYQLKKLTGTL